MNSAAPKETIYRALAALLLAGLLFSPSGFAVPPVSEPTVPVIVQAGDTDAAAAAVQRVAGQVTRELSIIQAVAADVPASQLAVLERAPGVAHVWPDAGVQRTETADPGTVYTARTGLNYEKGIRRGNIRLSTIAAYDGRRVTLKIDNKGGLSEGNYHLYTFAPGVYSTALPGVIDLNFVFKENQLDQAQLEVYQASTGTWHLFPIDTHTGDGQDINVVFDLSQALTTAEDLAQVQVRFRVAAQARRAKAEVDFVSLHLAELVGEVTSVDVSQAFEAVNAAAVWARGNTGARVSVAVLDSGVKRYRELRQNSRGIDVEGLIKGFNALRGGNNYGYDIRYAGQNDMNGHGTLVASIVSNARRNSQGKYYGVAPDSFIVPVRVLDHEGKGSYSQVIEGIQWTIDHKDEYNIRVMNMSLSAAPQSYYWDDPLNQAVMRAWQAGIVVVVAAGNSGPDPMSIGVPGNVPYVITVGALTDAYTSNDWSDDYIPPFSAAGPTVEGFVKPDLIAPGAHVVGLMSDRSKLAKDHPEFKVDSDYYQFSGTSMAAAQVSGVVALMLAQDPGLTPDQVKHRLTASARPALDGEGNLAFSVWQQGAGRVNAFEAVYGAYQGVANQGMDIAADLSGTQHYGGYTRWDPETNQYYLLGPDGYAWGGGYAWGDAYAWGDGYTWGDTSASTSSAAPPSAQPTPEPPMAEPTPEVAPAPTEPPTAEPTAEPTQEPTPEPTAEPTQEPTPEATPEPTQEPTPEATVAPVQEPAPEATAEPTSEPTPEPTGESAPTTLHVADLDGLSAAHNQNKWQASVSITVLAADGSPVPEAAVSGAWSGGDQSAATCTTDANGQCSLSIDKIDTSQSSITWSVTDVAHATFSYQPADNADPDADSDGTAITINQPQSS